MTPLASTRVWRDGTPYDVSTIDRACSAAASYGALYAETIVWEVLPDGTRGAILCQSESAQGSIAQHLQTVSNLRDFGLFAAIVDEKEQPK